MSQCEHPLIVVAGPTGTGKSDLALRLAETLRRSGLRARSSTTTPCRSTAASTSAAPSRRPNSAGASRITSSTSSTRHDEFNAADYARLAREVCADIDARGKRAILVGGTFFYLRALLSGLPEMPGRDEALRERIRAIAARPRGPERLHRWLSKIDAAKW